MQAIKGKQNRTTELLLAQELRKAGLKGWRRHQPLPGRPDFTFPARRVVVFVDGCFWHGCPRCYKAPARNAAFWARKVTANKRRDRRVVRSLGQHGWKVLRIWEHLLSRNPATAVNRVLKALGATRTTPRARESQMRA
jgi:DNA mismatch endonuclease (patch repair protein)